MSVHDIHRIDLVCDFPGCYDWWQGNAGCSEKEEKRQASLEGWKIDGDNCICPKHAEPEKKPKKKSKNKG